mgnify:CR=1 FL=1
MSQTAGHTSRMAEMCTSAHCVQLLQVSQSEVEIRSKSSVTVGYINEGEVFGEQSVLLGTNRTVTAKATKDCVAIKIPKENLLEEFSKSSVLIKAILRSTYLRLTNLNSTKRNDLKNLFGD